jgi:uncharacterized protein YndB with AHSA1/START domain
MSVKIDESGRRSVEVEVEVAGTPEEVWRAIATGPGVSAWFVPTEIEEGEGGQVVSHFGPGMDAIATVTAWEPPRRFAADCENYAPGAPPMATEWIVEARSGGTCVVRVVHSLFASSEDWDAQLESTEEGWPTFFRVLQLYLEHFSGAESASLSLMGMAAGDVDEAWRGFTSALGLDQKGPGERCAASAPDAPRLAGVVEPLADIGHGRRVLLRLDEPTHGVAMLGAFDCGGAVMATVSLYLYGKGAAEAIARDEPRWRAWMERHYPAASSAGSGA